MQLSSSLNLNLNMVQDGEANIDCRCFSGYQKCFGWNCCSVIGQGGHDMMTGQSSSVAGSTPMDDSLSCQTRATNPAMTLNHGVPQQVYPVTE